jgi:hypothetical protein
MQFNAAVETTAIFLLGGSMPRLRRFFSRFCTHPSALPGSGTAGQPKRQWAQVALSLSLALAFTLIAGVLAAGAQEVTGSIIGTVTDPQGAVLSGAKVEAKNVDRGTIVSTQTNAEGDFNITRLPIGNYVLSVTLQGFQKSVHPAFALVLNQTARVDFHMNVGQTTETVEVSGEAPLLETATTDVGTHINSVATENIPLITHNYNQLTLLSPGTVSLNPGAFIQGQNTFQIGRPYVNGQREQVNNYILDGMDNNQNDNNEVAYSPNPDAIQEFNLITQNPSAEFGNFLGGVVNVSTKSGTNQYHGSGFEYLKNYAMNANNWFNNAQGFTASGSEAAKRPQLHYNLFGATFGGPIIKDKLFFFVDYEGQKSSTPSSQSAGVLSAAERTGNFGELLAQGIQLYKPQAGVAPGSRTLIPGNNLTAAGLTLSPAALAVVNSSFYPLPNGPGNVFLYQQVQKNNFNQGDIKLDYKPDQNDQYSIRYSQQGVLNTTTANYAFNPNGIPSNYYPLQNFVADWTKTLSSSMVNDLRFGVNYFPVNQSFTNTAGKNLPQAFGIAGSPSSFLPSLFALNFGQQGGGNGFGNVANIANNLGAQNAFHDTTIRIGDVLSKTWEAHEFRLGFQFDRFRDNFFYPGNEGVAGQFGFGGQFTSLNGAANTGSGLADLMLGLPSNVGLGAVAAGNRYMNNSLVGAFFQDNWRIRKDLTLNLGLRWDLNSARVATGGDAINYSLFGGVVETPTINNDGTGKALYHTYGGIANFEPRIGLAWQPWFVRNTVVHAAYGISNYMESNGVNNLLTANPPFQIAHSVTYVGTSAALPGSTLDQGFSAFPASACTLAAALAQSPACFSGVQIHVFDPNLRPEMHYQWTFGVEHQFGNATTLQVGYVGSADQHLSNIVMLDQKVFNANGPGSPSPFLNPTLLATIAHARLTVNNGLSNYHALQTELIHRFSHGLQAQLSYTWSKCLSDAPGFFGQFGDAAGEALTVSAWAFPQNTYNQRLDYGRCPSDIASLFNGYAVYELPFGHGKSFANNLSKAMDYVVGGWKVSTSMTFHTGFAQTIFGNDNSQTGSVNSVAYCNRGVPQTVPMTFTKVGGTPFVNFLNPNAVSANPINPTTASSFGTCGIGSFRGPGYRTADLSLAKSFSVTERQSLELRADAFNFTNHPIFAFGNEFGGQHSAGSSVFGKIDASQGERQVQLGIKYRF